MHRFVSLLSIALIAVGAHAEPATKPAPAARSIPELKAQLETILHDEHIPGVSVAIVHRDGPEWVAGVGLADVASATPATSATLFRIGSTSKAFTSLAILQLVNEGKISLQDPVRKLVPDVWFENPWEATDPVRVVDLLEHTTGWDDMHLREFAKDAPGLSLSEGLNYDHHSRTSRWRPGTRMAYCNSGLAVAGAIIEKVTGQRFEDYVDKHLFKPIGMATATYLPPQGRPTTTLYHPDGKTPYRYSHILLRPAGSINASAEDMAAYLQFYLNRGHAHGTAVMPAESIDRVEVPTRSWAAQNGLRLGYGLSNYATVAHGFVYHGHDGGVNGGLTRIAYLPEFGVGYSFSINAGNGNAFEAIATALQAYVTRELARPAPPAAAPMPAAAADYAGWYQPDSPRIAMFAFLGRLIGLTRVTVDARALTMTGSDLAGTHYVPVSGMQLRRNDAPDHAEPVASLQLIKPNVEGRFIGLNGFATLKHIPAWLAIAEIVLTAWFVIAVASILLYAPFWLLNELSKKRRRPAERPLRLWPLVWVLCLCSVVGICYGVRDDFLDVLGTLTIPSLALFVATLVFAAAAPASAIAVWKSPAGVRRIVRAHAIFVSIILVIATLYLAYWGVIGLRTWG